MAGSAETTRDAGPDAAGLGRRVAARLRESLRDPEQVLALVLLGAFVARAVWLTLPSGSLIFDEAFYVNAARILLGWDVAEGAHYAGATPGLDPNMEHPPLGKVLMAASMAVFGDNGLGWRLPSLIAGMVALGAVYRIVRAAGESQWLGVLAVGILALDNLTFVHGRIGTLDMLVLAPILLAAWMALRDRWLVAGGLVGLGLLVKLTALYGLLALLVLAGIALLERWRRARALTIADFRPAALLLLGTVVVAGAGLTILDSRYTTFASPVDHVRHMLQYGAALTREGGPPEDCISNDSTPWQWLVNDCEMRYLRVAETTRVDGEVIASHASIDFRGAMNPALLGAMVFAVPFAGLLALRRRSRLALWSLVWMGANYLPFIPLVLFGQRVTYIYYFLPVVPALAAAIALLLLRAGLPRILLWAFVAAYAWAYAAYFPFREIP
ncbi:MAG TPA: glycosyltransferase family 39 protein [Candidatus Limnocylindrales bacterium]|nr:glycosyltransferase family 39 protein [Candidatus Limnocylindrales bacterium]